MVHFRMFWILLPAHLNIGVMMSQGNTEQGVVLAPDPRRNVRPLGRRKKLAGARVEARERLGVRRLTLNDNF